MLQTDRTLQEFATSMSPADVLDAAKMFFARNLNIYTAFLEKEGPTFAAFRGQGGEELLIGVEPLKRAGDAEASIEGAGRAEGTATRVTGSSYLFDQQIARFFATLPPAGASKAAGYVAP